MMSDGSQPRGVRIAARGTVATVGSAVLGVLLTLSEPSEGLLIDTVTVVLMIFVGWVVVAAYELAVWGMAVVFGRLRSRFARTDAGVDNPSIYTPTRSLLVLVSYFVGSGLAAFAFAGVAAIWGRAEPDQLHWILVPSMIAGALAAAGVFRRFASNRDLIELRHLLRYRAASIVRLGILGGMLFGLASAWVLPQLLPITDSYRPGVLAQMASAEGWTRLWLVLLAIATAPIVEELIFRGVLLEGLLRKYGRIVALLATTVVFGIAHVAEVWGHWPGIVTILGGGWLLAELRLRTGSLVPGIAAHAGYNSIAVLLAWIAAL